MSEPTNEDLIAAGLIKPIAVKPKSNPKAEAIRLEALETAKRRYAANAQANQSLIRAVQQAPAAEQYRKQFSRVSVDAIGPRIGQQDKARAVVQGVLERLGVDVGPRPFVQPKLPECVVRAKALRNHRVTRATPAWADMEAIAAVYAERDRLQAETGIPHHVDHIYALAGKTFCGLHVHQNLRAIPASVNTKKWAHSPQ